MVGADIAELQALADAFTTSAELVERISVQLTPRIMSSGWHGPDVERFRHDWNHVHRGTLSATVHSLQEVAGILRLNARQQEQASAAGTAGRVAFAAVAGASPVVACIENPTPTQANEWWDSLTPEQREYQITRNPAYVGNLDGLPAAVRDRANRIELDRELARTPCEPGDSKYAQLMAIKKSLETTGNAWDRQRQLLVFKPDKQPPGVAIGFGDVDTADHVSVFTPGMNTKVVDLPHNVSDTVSLKLRAENMMWQQYEDGQTVATVYWLDYHSPQWAQAAVGTDALEGGQTLASFADGIDASRPDGVHLTALGHSYGSVVTGVALRGTSAFDDAVVFGSPGLGTDDAHDLNVPDGHLYVMESGVKGWPGRGLFGGWDAVADSGYYGPDPSGMDGAVQLSTSQTTHGGESSGHSEYLKVQTTAQYNAAAVISGNSQLVVRK